MESPKNKSSHRHSKPDPENSQEKSFMRFYSLAFELVVMNLVLIIAGFYLDEYLNTSPVFILTGVFLSLSGTIWLLLRFTK
ncbi:Putative F0F1-ATPase subunit Ca2+/Mg2+ transporter [Ekhidna lutea]|uniref:Putative F0F1-ATPase subunit Ca2+/Mg2+ transporter n=2 Tax=Ekhidna lutea TaxID=447679 RepID=A0A239FBC3_EKHLU|nr:Putative F0F1-ATPase subunit Ca2+/Mg2+ transporter [Ekhidna lutea]